jgi:GT2 family glycosyltransferase
MNANFEMAQHISEMLVTLVEAGKELFNSAKNEQWTDFFEIAAGMREMCLSIERCAKGNKEQYYDTLWKTVENSRVSLERIVENAEKNSGFVLQKTEFELIPLLRVAYNQFYYSAVVEQDGERKEAWMNGEGEELWKNQYAEEAERTGYYKYDMSIVVLAYNKLEFTKLCVENVLRNLPKEATYELILINHGSNDGTKEFFEEIHPDKQLDLKNNGNSVNCQFFVIEGKYLMFVSNDVVITPNTFDILYQAFEDDERIGMAAPMTSNVENLQIPQANGFEFIYENVEQLYQRAVQHNQRNKYLEEVRSELRPPLYMIRNKLQGPGTMYMDMFGSILMYPDDALSMFVRRKGYKNVLMKDIYCHHYGSLTIRENKFTAVDYDYGRKVYLEKFGIDPHGKGSCWDEVLFETLVCDKKDARRVLGINCGMGSDPLKIQQELRERTHNENVELVIFSNRERDINELLGFSDAVYLQKDWAEVFSDMEGVYDYIIVEGGLVSQKESENVITQLYGAVAENGKLILYLTNQQIKIQQSVMRMYQEKVTETEWGVTGMEIDEIKGAVRGRIGKYFIIDK